jgi:predicted flavoprotein YhiN
MELPERKKFNNYSSEELVGVIKSYKLNLKKTFIIDRAISTAGGVAFSSIDEKFMLLNNPNVFITGEMLDWEAPTGGYLLQACIANGVYVANNIMKQINTKNYSP